MQLRDLPAEERAKARERISADVRARIGDMLTPEQKPGYAAILAESAGRTSTPRAASTCWPMTASRAPTTCAWASPTAPAPS